MIDKILSPKTIHTAGLVFLWTIYAAIGVLVYFIANTYLETASILLGVVAVIVVAGTGEILDRKLGWSKPVEKKEKEPLTPAHFLDKTTETGARAIVREYVELGGSADDIKAEMARRNSA